jgi:hypothetical protein
VSGFLRSGQVRLSCLFSHAAKEQRMRILIVEDDRKVASFLERGSHLREAKGDRF